ncbi:unnamed protein product [Schistocephalus solidus]|uniref:Cleavage stimulation factor subunit 2 tau variant n=1 Tax=Schistocephalus solidus TaxID=70667 RepID=A0A183TJG4_SCHSO|nr:unnamed protein product [Schistocephalus solidus]
MKTKKVQKMKTKKHSLKARLQEDSLKIKKSGSILSAMPMAQSGDKEKKKRRRKNKDKLKNKVKSAIVAAALTQTPKGTPQVSLQQPLAATAAATGDQKKAKTRRMRKKKQKPTDAAAAAPAALPSSTKDTSVQAMVEAQKRPAPSTAESVGAPASKRKRQRRKKKKQQQQQQQQQQPQQQQQEQQPKNEKEKKKPRKKKKKKTTSEATGTVQVNAPMKAAKQAAANRSEKTDVASSDSEAELIHADWHLADSSAEEGKDDEESASPESDLEESEEDRDEDEPAQSEPSADSDGSQEEEDSDDDEEEEEPFGDRSKPAGKICLRYMPRADEPPASASKKTQKTAKTRKTTVNSDGAAPAKRFSTSDRHAILREVKSRAKELDSRCLYVSPIPSNCTFDMLKSLSPKMTCCRFVLKPHSNVIRSYAFCEYADADTAAKEKVNLSGRLFCGKSVRAESKSTRPEEDGSVDQLDFSRLLVSGLLPSVTASDLRTVFPSASDIRLPTAPSTGANLGWTALFKAHHSCLPFLHRTAVLHFLSEAVAVDAFSHGHKFVLKGKPISVTFPFKHPETAQSREGAASIKSSALVRPGQAEAKPATQTAPVTATPPSAAAAAAAAVGTAPKAKVLIETIANSEEEDEEEKEKAAPTEIEASLDTALMVRKASAKTLKAPGAKRNWMAASATGGKPTTAPKTKSNLKRSGAMPKILPVPGKKRR